MQLPKFSITRCSNNSKRWNVYFNNLKPFQMHSIQKMLVKRQYKVLATTPSLKVFRSKEVRLTCHIQGLIQIDSYSSSIQKVEDIEHLIKDIFDLSSNNFFR